MNFAFSEEQDQLRDAVRKFCEAKSPETEVRRLMETTEGYDPAVWSQMANELGLQSLHIPEEFGGQGFTFVELGIVLEEMGRVLLCAPYFSSVVLAAGTILNAGTDAQKGELLPGIAAGELAFCIGMSEPDSGSDLAATRTRAIRDGDVYRVTGTKVWTSFAHEADWVILFCRTGSGGPAARVPGSGSTVAP